MTRQLQLALAAVAALGVALLLWLIPMLGGSGGPSAPGPPDPAAEREAAIRFWEERARQNPQGFVAYNQLAFLYLQRSRETGGVEDVARAEEALRRSLASLPTDNYEATALLATVYVIQHRFAEALPPARAAVESRPRGALAYGVLGDAYLNLGQYEEAAQAYQRLEELQPGLGASARLAQLAYLSGDLAKAEVLWQEALADRSQDREPRAWARVQLGHQYLQSGRWEEAEYQFEAALNELPGYVHALAGLAALRAARGDYEKAAELYQRAVDLLPTPQYVVSLGDVYAAAGDREAAERAYALVGVIRRLYEANGVNVDLTMVLFAADHHQELDETLGRAEALVERQPGIYAWDALAWTLFQAGRYQEAWEASEKALQLGTRDPLLLFHAGMIADRRGDPATALRLLEEVAELNPRFSPLWADLAQSTLEELRALAVADPEAGR